MMTFLLGALAMWVLMGAILFIKQDSVLCDWVLFVLCLPIILVYELPKEIIEQIIKSWRDFKRNHRIR